MDNIGHLILLPVYIGFAIYMIVEPDVVGQATGTLRHRIDAPTPAGMVRFAGCAMLAVFPGGAGAYLFGSWWAGVLVGLAFAIGIYVVAERFLPR
jgi:hypothetical protein